MEQPNPYSNQGTIIKRIASHIIIISLDNMFLYTQLEASKVKRHATRRTSRAIKFLYPGLIAWDCKYHRFHSQETSTSSFLIIILRPAFRSYKSLFLDEGCIINKWILLRGRCVTDTCYAIVKEVTIAESARGIE